MRSIFFAIAALGASIASADNIVSITSPLTGTVYTAGKPALITWIDATVATIPAIVIAKGEPTNLQAVSTIASNVDASSGSYTWNIPADFAPGADYALELGTSPNISFTGLFTIQAGDGTGASSSGSASASASDSSASTSVASSSILPTSSAASSFASSATPSSSAAASSSPAAASSSKSASPSASATPNAANKKTTALAGVMVGSVVAAMLLA